MNTICFHPLAPSGHSNGPAARWQAYEAKLCGALHAEASCKLLAPDVWLNNSKINSPPSLESDLI